MNLITDIVMFNIEFITNTKLTLAQNLHKK